MMLKDVASAEDHLAEAVRLDPSSEAGREAENLLSSLRAARSPVAAPTDKG